MDVLMMVKDIFTENGIELPTIESADAMENPTAVAKFSNGKWCWFIIGGKALANDDFYLYGLVNGIEKELGMFTLKQILEVGAELDTEFTPVGVFDIYDDFDLRY